MTNSTQLSRNNLDIITTQLEPFVRSPSGLLLMGLLLVVGILSLSNKEKKGKLATSRFGGTTEKAKAKKKAKKQLLKQERNSVPCYIGTPPDIQKNFLAQWYEEGFITEKPPLNIFPKSSTLWLPDMQRGCSVIGAAGSGKTFSVIDPLVRASVDLGYPVCLYDFKYPAQTSRIVAYAMKRGYKVRVFAPGFPESEICNPLDLIKDEEDAIAAGQLAQVINRNADRGGINGTSDKFFEEAGDTLVEGIFLATKAVGKLMGDDSFCDLMMAQAILSLPSLAQRIELASNEGKLGIWTSRPFSQLISVKDSEKTVSSIVGTAQKVFQRFIKKEYIGSFCGQTTLPLDLEGKQLVIFGMDRNNRDIVGPLLASILHVFVSRNVSRSIPRKDPFVCVLDEVPTLFLPQLVKWLNENREDGFVGILGYQNMGQMEKAYGKELTRAILGGTATKFIFNPQDSESAKYFADYIGDEEIQYKTKSNSKNRGKGGSSSTSQQVTKRPLIEAAQLLKMETGQAIIINPSFSGNGEHYLPLKQKIKIPKFDLKEMNHSIQKWEIICDSLIKRQKNDTSEEERTRQFDERKVLAEYLFPLPSDSKKKPIGEDFFDEEDSNSKINLKKEAEFLF